MLKKAEAVPQYNWMKTSLMKAFRSRVESEQDVVNPPTSIQTDVIKDIPKPVWRPSFSQPNRSGLVSRVKYCNTLPDIPFDPKFINYPFDAKRYVRYKQTSLEKNYRYEVLTEHDLGVTIDLINPEAYTPVPGAQLHPTDERLLEDDILTLQDGKRSRHQHINASWLRRTEYISNEPTRFQPQNNNKMEATIGFATRRKKALEENVYTDRDSQLEAIEKTFQDVKVTLKNHYIKPGVTAVEELPIYPDFDLWKYPCAQVIFDSDPAPVGRPMPAQLEEMSQAMIRGVADKSGEQFAAYFLPTDDTLKKRKRDVGEGVEYMDGDEYDYVMAREYNWNVKNKASKGYEENYFVVIRNDGVFYNELETRVCLSKPRLKQGQQPNNSRLVVRHRPLIAQEHKSQRFREKMLEPPGEEEMENEKALKMYSGKEMRETSIDINMYSAKGSDSEGSERSRSRSGSKEPARSRSGSRSRRPSGSRSRSRSHNGSRSRSHSRSRGKSRSAKSGASSRSAQSSRRSRRGSPAVNGSVGHSGSPAHSKDSGNASGSDSESDSDSSDSGSGSDSD
nr:RNA polymerase II-associated factor 1 homolog [Procambarus clarkii]